MNLLYKSTNYNFKCFIYGHIQLNSEYMQMRYIALARRVKLYFAPTSLLWTRLSFRNATTSTVLPFTDRLIDLNEFDLLKIRNFSIIAHIDHGKSTLADGLLEFTGTIDKGADNAQVLDKLRVERERGITVKAQTATMFYKYKGENYLLNLIDTPGHVDFSYEVSRSLAACDGALLLVDANQGVQAQTVANFWLAFEQDLTIVGVVNKIDMPNARPDVVEEQMSKLFDLDPSLSSRVSARHRLGIEELMNVLVERIKPPQGDREKPLKAFVFDSWYNAFKGCYALVLIKDGVIRKGQEIVSLQTKKKYEVQEVGIMYPEPKPVEALFAGQVGYVLANIRNVREVHIGDTYCLSEQANVVEPLPGFKKTKPVVFAGVYPVETVEYDTMRDAVEKLSLNDPSVHVETETSPALGIGWRVGFLGVLHMEVFIQRLEQEYNANVILTSPSVSYITKLKDTANNRKRYENKTELIINDPSKFPEPIEVEEYLEPMTLCTIITPLEYYKSIETLCNSRRGEQIEAIMIDNDRMLFKYRFPLADIIVDFFNTLKKISSGYASFDYDLDGYRSADLVKVDILLNGTCINEFSLVTTRDQARSRGVILCKRLMAELDQQPFQVAIQAAVGTKILARETIRPLSKSFAGKLKGNFAKDRLAKLVKNRKEGRKHMKSISNIEIHKDAFKNVLKQN